MLHTQLSVYSQDDRKAEYRLDNTDLGVYVDASENDYVRGIICKSRYKAAVKEVLYYGPDAEPLEIPHFAETLADLREFMFARENVAVTPMLLDGDSLLWFDHDCVYRAPFAVPLIAELGKGHWFGIPFGLSQAFVRLVAFGLEGGLTPRVRAAVCGEDMFTLEVRLDGFEGTDSYVVSLRVPRQEMFGPWANLSMVYAEMLKPMPVVAKVQGNSLKHALTRTRTGAVKASHAKGYKPDQVRPLAELHFEDGAPLSAEVCPLVDENRLVSEGRFDVQTIEAPRGNARVWARQSILEAFAARAGKRPVFMATDSKGSVMQLTVRPEASLTVLGGYD
jgi:hypothetical protein